MILVTGSSGHLGEALIRTLRQRNQPVRGIDIIDSDFTDVVASISSSKDVQDAMQGINCVFHTATLHKPHVATHSKQDFIDTNVTGTLNLLEAAAQHSVSSFIFTSTTSVYGHAMKPAKGAPAAWVTEALTPAPKNIYGITKLAAENLCRLFHQQYGLNTLALRTSRFFPEEDDDREKRGVYSDQNIKALEFLYRRVEISDVVDAHLLAAVKAKSMEFAPYIISATSPFSIEDLNQLNQNADELIKKMYPGLAKKFTELQWQFFKQIDRVYVNDRARMDLGWEPKFDFCKVTSDIAGGRLHLSNLVSLIGSKGYHDKTFEDGPYPVE